MKNTPFRSFVASLAVFFTCGVGLVTLTLDTVNAVAPLIGG